MIKTITTFRQNTPTLPQDKLDAILNQCAIWQTEGKYTGEVSSTISETDGSRHAERWAWADNATALAYKTLVESTWIELYPDVNVDIVVV